MKTSKILAMLLALIMIAAAMTGCKAGEPAAAPAGEAAPAAQGGEAAPADAAAEDIVLRFAHVGDEVTSQVYQKLADYYHEQNPHVTIEMEPIPRDGFEQKLVSAFASGSAADINEIDLGSLINTLCSGEEPLLVNFEEYADYIDMTYFDKGAMETYGYRNDRLVAIPTALAGLTMLVNVSEAEKYGVDLNGEFTVSKFFEEAAKVHAANPDIWLCGYNAERLNFVLQTWLKQQGSGQLFNMDYTVGFTAEDLTKVLTMLKEGYDKQAIQPMDQFTAMMTAEMAQSHSGWMGGTLLTNPTWGGGLPYYGAYVENKDSKLEAYCFPLIDGTTNGTSACQPSSFMTVNAACPYPEEAVKFVDFFLNSFDACDILQSEMGVYFNTEMAARAVEKGYILNYVAQATQKALADPLPDANLISQDAELTTIIRSAGERVAYGEDPVAVAADSMAQFETKLAELKAAGTYGA